MTTLTITRDGKRVTAALPDPQGTGMVVKYPGEPHDWPKGRRYQIVFDGYHIYSDDLHETIKAIDISGPFTFIVTKRAG